MIHFCMKRSLVSTAPWVFNQFKLPDNKTILKDNPLSLFLIKRMESGYKYAFDSITSSFCDQDLDTLTNCLEPSLYSHVSASLSNLRKNNIEFRYLSNKPLDLIPLSFTLHLGVRTDRKLNPKTGNTKPMSLSDNEILLKMLNPPEEVKDFIKNICFYGINPFMIKYSVITVEMAFFGDPVLGLFKENEQINALSRQKEYHILKFEAEVPMNYFMNANFYRKHDFGFIDNANWSVSDIDNRLNGNSFF